MTTEDKKPSLLAAAMGAVPASSKFDLEKDEVVKQTLSIPLVKVLPNSPTTSQLFEHATLKLFCLERNKRKHLYLCEPELYADAALDPYIHTYMIASGRTNDGEMFLSYCQLPDSENPNSYHTSGIRLMQLALTEPTARKPYEKTDSAYEPMRYGPNVEKPIIKDPYYPLDEMLELAFDGREILNFKSAAIIELKSLQLQAG